MDQESLAEPQRAKLDHVKEKSDLLREWGEKDQNGFG